MVRVIHTADMAAAAKANGSELRRLLARAVAPNAFDTMSMEESMRLENLVLRIQRFLSTVKAKDEGAAVKAREAIFCLLSDHDPRTFARSLGKLEEKAGDPDALTKASESILASSAVASTVFPLLRDGDFVTVTD